MKTLATRKDPLQRATGLGAGVGERGEGNTAHIVQSWEGKGGLAFRSHRADRGCCFLFWGVGEGRQKLEVSALLPVSVSPLTSGGSPGGLPIEMDRAGQRRWPLCPEGRWGWGGLCM